MRKVKVFVPQDSAALSVGADDVATLIVEEAAKRNLEIELVRNGSHGMLWLEPLVEVVTEQGRIAYGPIETADVADLFDHDFLSGGMHDKNLGLTAEIDYLKNQERLIFNKCGLTDPTSIDDYRDHDGFKGLKHAFSMSPEKICSEVLDSGLRGRGGAGFPTGIKWKTVLDAGSDQKYICCNADEGDSGTFADRMIMEGDPYCLIEGMIIAGYSVGASEGYIYLRSEYPYALKTLNKAIKYAQESGYLGENIQGSGFNFNLEIRVGAGAYICGEETSMLESLEGKRGMVRQKPPIPALRGLFDQPTVVNNVLTLCSVPYILAEGAKAYQEYGVGRSRGTQPFQLAGNIKRGGLVEKAFGVTLKELLYDFGGGTFSQSPIRAVQIGGPLGAYSPNEHHDLEMDYEAFSERGAMLGHGGIVVFDETVDLAKQARFAMEFCAIESCGKCTPCRIGSQRGVEVMDHIIEGQDLENNLIILNELCDVMTSGSMCAMGGLTPVPIQSALKHFKEDFQNSELKTAAQ